MWIFYLCLISSALGSSLVPHEKRELPFSEGRERRRIEKHALLPMRIGLMQNAHAQSNAEKWLMDVSHPDSPNYGRHWTQDEIINAFKPSEDTLSTVTTWLNSHGIFEFTHSDNKMWFAFDVPVAKAEFMFQTEYFEHEARDGGFEASCDNYYLPAYVQPHVHYVTPGVKSSDITGRTARSRLHRSASNSSPSRARRSVMKRESPPYNSSTSLEHCAREVTPACIRALYHFSAPDPTSPVNTNNSLGIVSVGGGSYSQSGLNTFYRYYAPDIPANTSPILTPIDVNATHAKEEKFDNTETDLDIMSAIPIIYPQRTAYFTVETRPDIEPATFPSWHNQWNRFFDAIDGSYCTYGQRRNSSQGGKLQCGTFKPTNVLSISYGSPEHIFSHYWQDRQCNEWLKLGLQGVSAFICSQDWGTGSLAQWNFNRSSSCSANNSTGERVFMPTWPANCPWVTAVGATEIRPNHTVHDPETGAEWPLFNVTTGKHLWGGSSGGGFSLHFDAPSYQKDAVSYYFNNHNPPWPYFYNGNWRNSTGRYNRNGRGFPDISAIGTHIATFDGHTYFPEDGTSASTPIVAALFNRIVEERLRAGKGPLGFVNPTLYKHPEALHDVVEGANGVCSRENGFEAAPGWDPVSGLGTPDYPKLLDVFMKLP